MAKSKDELIYDIENNLVDSDTGKITGDRVKARLLDMVETMAESAGSGGGAMEYWRVPDGLKQHLDSILLLFVLTKISNAANIEIAPAAYAYMGGAAVDAFAYIPTLKMHLSGVEATAAEILANEFSVDLVVMGFTPMTEEEFYNTTIA